MRTLALCVLVFVALLEAPKLLDGISPADVLLLLAVVVTGNVIFMANRAGTK